VAPPARRVATQQTAPLSAQRRALPPSGRLAPPPGNRKATASRLAALGPDGLALTAPVASADRLRMSRLSRKCGPQARQTCRPQTHRFRPASRSPPSSSPETPIHSQGTTTAGWPAATPDASPQEIHERTPSPPDQARRTPIRGDRLLRARAPTAPSATARPSTAFGTSPGSTARTGCSAGGRGKIRVCSCG
jgi:hypothetical protein